MSRVYYLITSLSNITQGKAYDTPYFKLPYESFVFVSLLKQAFPGLDQQRTLSRYYAVSKAIPREINPGIHIVSFF